MICDSERELKKGSILLPFLTCIFSQILMCTSILSLTVE